MLAYRTDIPPGSVMEKTLPIGEDTVIDFLELISLDLYV
jgi:hypothetical protein